MRCLIKIPRRYLICLSLSAAFSFCLSVFGFVSDSYAISGTCTYNLTTYSTGTNLSNSTYCSDLNNNELYIYLISYDFTVAGSGFDLTSFRFVLRDSGGDINFPFYFVYPSSSCVDSSCSFSASNLSPFYVPNFSKDRFTPFNPYIRILFSGTNTSNARFNGSFVLGYTDSLGGSCEPCPEPEEPEPCPPIPENPYDNKLDDIKKSILTIGAIMIMIYFFFIVYKIIVKDGGSRR